MRNLLMIFVAVTAVACSEPADVVNNYYFPASQDEQSSEDPSTNVNVNLTVNIHINDDDNYDTLEDTGFLETGDTGFYDDDSGEFDTADTGLLDTADTGIFDSEEFDTADSGLSDTADSGNEIVDTGTPDPTTSHPCDDPAVTVINSRITSTTVRGGFRTIGDFVFTAGENHLLLTDLTLTLASDDDTSDNVFDRIPNPQDHIQYCYLNYAGLMMGPNPVGNTGEIVFDNVDLPILAHKAYWAVLVCQFSNIEVENGNDDSYAVYVAKIDDMIFTEQLTGNAVSEDNICLPYGLPNASFESETIVMNNGLLEFDPAINNSTHELIPDRIESILDIYPLHMIEYVVVDDLHYVLDGDLSVIETVDVIYTDSLGVDHYIVTLPDINGNIWLQNLDAAAWGANHIDLRIHVYNGAQSGGTLQATLVTQDTVAYGRTSGQILDPTEDIFPGNDIVGDEFVIGCSFNVLLSDGSIAQMQSDVQMWPSSNTPSGIYTPSSELEVLRYEVSADAGCTNDEILVESKTFWLLATDNSGSGWTANNYIEIQDLSTGDMLYTGTIPQGQPVPLTLDLAIPPGTTHTIGVFLDTIGASTFNDDCVRMYIEEDSLDWSDNQNVATNVEHEEILGNTICF